jgi:hypothetical protein
MLVTVERYRTITKDTTTAEAAVLDALADAQALLEGDLGRGLESAERTERLQLHSNLRVYPAVTPITVADGYTIYGFSELLGASPAGGPFDLTDPQYAEVTYTGGYTAATVPTCIERDIAWAAYQLLGLDASSHIPAGATSVRVGDTAVTFAKPRSAADAGIRWTSPTLRYRRRRL